MNVFPRLNFPICHSASNISPMTRQNKILASKELQMVYFLYIIFPCACFKTSQYPRTINSAVHQTSSYNMVSWTQLFPNGATLRQLFFQMPFQMPITNVNTEYVTNETTGSFFYHRSSFCSHTQMGLRELQKGLRPWEEGRMLVEHIA